MGMVVIPTPNVPLNRQRQLFDILRTHANADPELGYCQGMSHIGATILLYFDEEVIKRSEIIHLFIRQRSPCWKPYLGNL